MLNKKWIKLYDPAHWVLHYEAKRLFDSEMCHLSIGQQLGVSVTTVREWVKAANLRDQILAQDAAFPDDIDLIRVVESKMFWELEKIGMHYRRDVKILCVDNLIMHKRMVIVPGHEVENPKITKFKLPLSTVNVLRAWLGVSPLVPTPRLSKVVSERQINRAKQLLEAVGYQVVPVVKSAS